MLRLIAGQTLVAAYGSSESGEAQADRSQTRERQPPCIRRLPFEGFAESGARGPREIKPAIAQETDAQVGAQRFTIATPQAESAFDEADCA